jgi:glycosyltransferase involved in cell wall biosynthesis
MVDICHIATMTNWGGVERLLVDYFTYPKEKSFSTSLLTTSSIPAIIQILEEAKVLTFQPDRRFHYDPRAIGQMANWLQNENVNIVHSHNSFANIWGTLAATYARVPNKICGEHGTVWWIKPPMAWLDRLSFWLADIAVVNSKASAMMLRKRYGIPSKKIRVVYNGVPQLPRVDKKEVRTDLGVGSKILIGSVGRLDTPKDFQTFIDAASLVANAYKEAMFMIIGGGPMEVELKEQIQDLNLEDRFIITGWRDDARRLMQAFDIFVSTSIHESFGNSIVEASLAGIPVVAPRVDGIPEIVIHEITGYLLEPQCPPRKPRSQRATKSSDFVLINDELHSPRSVSSKLLTEILLYLIENPNLRFNFGEAARRRTKKMFTIESYIENLELIYRNLIV